MLTHVPITRDGEHLGYLHKDLNNAIRDLEPKFGKEIYKTLGNIIRHKHGAGNIMLSEFQLRSSKCLATYCRLRMFSLLYM